MLPFIPCRSSATMAIHKQADQDSGAADAIARTLASYIAIISGMSKAPMYPRPISAVL
jgi:hypothetical protein